MCRDIDEAKQRINILDYVRNVTGQEGKRSGKLWRFFPCPKCGSTTKPGHFLLSEETQTFSSQNSCCKAGDVLRFMTEVEGYSNSDAVKRLLNSSNIKSDINRYVQKKKREFKQFYSKLTDQFKYWSSKLEEAKEKRDMQRVLFCELNRNFFDQYSEKFIQNGYYEKNDYLASLEDNAKNNYNKEVLNEYTRLVKHLAIVDQKKFYEYDEYEEMLIFKTQQTIKKFIEQNEDNTAISFSGGKDSTVLLHIIRNIMKIEIPAIFCNTGVEYDAIVKFVNTFENITVVKPKKSFVEVIRQYGYPAISKEQSRYIYDVQNPEHSCEKVRKQRLSEKGNFHISKKWRFLINSEFKLSNKCCYYLKKAPLKKLKYKYFTGERCSESNLRRQQYHTCILPNKCVPMRLWTDELVDKFIHNEKINICDIYLWEDRTGCKFCLYGCQFEKEEDRIDRLKEIEPKSYKFAESIGLIKLKDIIKNGKLD
jgi:3'-phosphoadenosine 5'-phosphosulfate sulfotransferase (PAPS reductase)/FAD synthetase